MSGKAKYVKVTIQSDAKSLAGYTVLGDVATAQGRQLVLERPEQAAAPAKKKAAAKKASGGGGGHGRATEFHPSQATPEVVGEAV